MNKQAQFAVPQNTTFVVVLFTPCPTDFKLRSPEQVRHDVNNYNKHNVSVNSACLPTAVVYQSA